MPPSPDERIAELLHEVVPIGGLQEPIARPQRPLQQGHGSADEGRIGRLVAILGGAHQG